LLIDSTGRAVIWSVCGHYWIFAVALILFAPIASAQERSIFPDCLPNEIEATVGRRVIVIPDGTDGLHHFPDGPLSILSARPLRFLMPVANKTVLVTGRDFGNLTSQVEIMGPSGSGPDANYAGVYSIWRRGPNDRFIAIYHGENHEGMGLMEGNNINGAVWSVCIGMIDAATGHVERRGEILRADKPKRPIVGRPHEIAALRIQGLGEPSMTPDRNGDYLLCYYTEASNRLDRRVCICVARSPIEENGLPGSWKKFYDGQWDEPGMGGHDTPVLTAQGGDAGQSFVTYIKQWERYLIVFCHQGFKDFEAGQAKQSGVYLATSKDGVRWTAPQRIMAAMTVPKTGRPFLQHPTLLVSSVTKDRLQGKLFHAHSPQWPTPHHLAASPITIQLRTQRPVASSASRGQEVGFPNEDSVVARWVLSKAGLLTIELNRDKSVVEVELADRLPQSDFQILKINLSKCNVSDNDVRMLSGLKRIEDVNLRETNIGDAAMSILTRLGSLTNLNVQDTKVTDAGLSDVARLTNLRYLNLAGLSIGRRGLSHVAQLVQLETLLLGGVQANDEAIGELGKLSNLRLLGLHFNKAVTNSAMPKLKNLQSLETIRLKDTRITDSVVKRYLPRCSIER
jgi:hypothetical protein